MKVSDLFSAEMERELTDWVGKFASVGDLFSAMPQLYANLRAQNIQGIVEDGAVIVGAVHIGIGSVVHAQAIVRGARPQAMAFEFVEMELDERYRMRKLLLELGGLPMVAQVTNRTRRRGRVAISKN